ncbi:hypothetical protein NEUTE1DRAFT_45455 [Neurospora tetrasperma FGSC 2508]|uniref:Apple domain-containing protein n=1 Tax=Neurospora tetrasperma (strain FGSC 2508 / ATCC MYA-4615 / P0657) TaxID=510951 RepID=F8MPS6_NEUT8|nr:uncharacterized protein NEUTE1DRAFT_45455 [Neurospora tetrasperma FGSC 2508]EGO57181.1 hypothetical protein NEUTE1DRAFT_45455 [Neurospora tetrasperma FGSC 2508]
MVIHARTPRFSAAFPALELKRKAEPGDEVLSFGNFPSYATSGLEGGADAYPQQPQDTKLLGLSVPVFWTVVIGLVMLLAGAIGGGIGGGLAASQHSSQSKASPPSSLSISGSSISSTTTTATIASPPSQSESASPLLTTTTSPTTTTGTQLTAFGPSPAPSDNCPSVNNTQYTPLDASGNSMTVAINPGGLTKVQSFVRICNRNYPAGAPHGNPDTLDIMKLYLPTLEACIDACATYNIVYQENRPQRPGGAQDGTDMGLCRSVAIGNTQLTRSRYRPIPTEGDYCYLKNATGKDNTFGNPDRYSVGVLLL